MKTYRRRMFSRIITFLWFSISLAFYLITLVHSSGEDGSLCSPGILTPGWTSPKGDIIRENGEPLEIYCTLDLSQKITEGRNASHLVFYKGKQLLPSEYVTVVNATTSRLYIRSLEPSNDMYYCKLKLSDEHSNRIELPAFYKNTYLTSLESSGSAQVSDHETMVCLNSVAIDMKPSEVKNFTCVSYNWEKLVCTWNPPHNYIKTNYRVYYQTPGRSGRKIMYPCPREHDILYNNCTWTIHHSSDPIYRRAFEYLFFTIVGENALGNITTNVKFHNFAHIIPNPPDKLKILDKTISSVYLQWSIGLLTVFEKGLTYKVEYTWNSSQPWNVTIYNQKSVNKTNDEISLNVTDLPYPNVLYDFRIYMKSAIATGENSWSLPATIIVKTKPTIPYLPPKTDVGNFEISHLYPTHRDVYLYWQPLSRYDQNGEDFHYEVYAVDNENEENHIGGGGDNTALKSTMVTYSYAKFSNLGLGSYKFLIKSVNKEGSSTESSEIFIPKSLDIIREPLVFTKIDFGGGVYELSWKHPATSKRDDFITNFTIFWCESNRERPYQCDGYLDWLHLPTDISIYNVTVNSQKGYQFAISANSAHSSSGMVWASCTVLHDKVGKMKNVWVNKIGSDFIELAWKLECSDRVEGIKGFKIFYCPTISSDNVNCKEPERNVTIVGDVSTVQGNLTNLKSYTSYKISMAVMTKEGEPGPRTDNFFNRTLDGPPDVDKLRVRVLSITNVTIKLNWDEPNLMNGVFQHYDIRYNENSLKITPSNLTTVTLSKLQSYTYYNISIFACTKLCSLIDRMIHIRTAIGRPGPVVSFTALKLNSSYALVKWNPPFDKSGPQPTYDVMLQVDNYDHNLTTHEFHANTTTDEYEVRVPECKHDENRLSYTFYVRAKNFDYSMEPPAFYIGDWSPAYTIDCIQPNLSGALKILIGFLTVISFVVLFFVVKACMYRCKKMKEVQVTLPPNFTLPSLFESGEKDSGNNSDNWKNKNAELDRLNITRLSAEEETDEDNENTILDEIDQVDEKPDLDPDPYSSGCCTGRNSSSSSMTGGTQTSDSGTEMEPPKNSNSVHLSLLCDIQTPPAPLQNFLSSDEFERRCMLKPPSFLNLHDDESSSWMDCCQPDDDVDPEDDAEHYTNSSVKKITPGYIVLQTFSSPPQPDNNVDLKDDAEHYTNSNVKKITPGYIVLQTFSSPPDTDVGVIKNK